MMVGAGTNYKSMAYVGNIVEFIKYKLKNVTAGYEVYNYVDKPDLNMNQLVTEVEQSLSKKIHAGMVLLNVDYAQLYLPS